MPSSNSQVGADKIDEDQKHKGKGKGKENENEKGNEMD
eukprot:CAMPEP_0116893366 /NCGR_PEP_ID=MMETSP0467-20121206/3367_1 /TAXON_ID=283647 /ORGANISM="Mesodinium pulex, Strain SPMC105" /LENGTH=37 /DNA_ID= /DNA_START= /DNA_END= /DNA_ORIENTATION=